MAEVVLDASAVLALVNREHGWEVVAAVLDEAVISAVNLSEVVAKLAAAGVPEGDLRAALDGLALEVVGFDAEDAFRAGMLRPATREAGLSFGDRACLAVASRRACAALTADRRWAELEVGPPVQLIRQ